MRQCQEDLERQMFKQNILEFTDLRCVVLFHSLTIVLYNMFYVGQVSLFVRNLTRLL